MCEYLNEENSVHAFLVNKIALLEEEVEEWKLKWIEATNPGIDMEEVKIGRAAHKRALELGNDLRSEYE